LTNSFLNKVTAERRVLALVNRRFPASRQLPGLSAAAISQWRIKVGADASDRLVEALLLLGKTCQSLSDRSHESFRALTPEVERELESSLVALREALNEPPL